MSKRTQSMAEIWIPMAFLALWFVMNRWILPRLGVPT